LFDKIRKLKLDEALEEIGNGDGGDSDPE